MSYAMGIGDSPRKRGNTETPVRHPLLHMRDIVKRYPGVLALDRVQFDLRGGEVHALVGENGAGKTTLMKILAGAIPADSGEISLDGESIRIHSPQHAQQLGISMIYQEFNLSPYLSAAENIFLGREPVRRFVPFVNWRRMYREARELLKRVGADIDVRLPVNRLSVAQQQMVEIAKALSLNARIIAMDEPSATLTEHELEALFHLIRSLKERGLGVIYISHRIEEIFQVADRVTVLRDGQWVVTYAVTDVTRESLIGMMVGRELREEFPPRECRAGAELLRVEGLRRGRAVRKVSFAVHRGEILGVTGLVGAGRTELARAIFGADPIDAGSIYLEGRRLNIASPRDAIRQGIGLLTEDRKTQGLIVGMTVRENVTLADLASVIRRVFVSRRLERSAAQRFIEHLRIRTPSAEQQVRNLSGGNQQKVVLAKWLFTKSKVLIFDEPTRGIDVGAKVEIYHLMNDLVARGVGVIMISSELPEVLGMCDRILVMHEGRLAAKLTADEATQEKVMFYATGGARQTARVA